MTSFARGREAGHTCLTTLSNACLASKALYRIAWPILYQFLQTICTKPERGLALRSLMIREWAPVYAMDPTELFEQLQGDPTLVDLFQWRAKTFWLGEDQISSASPNELHTDDSLINTTSLVGDGTT